MLVAGPAAEPEPMFDDAARHSELASRLNDEKAERIRHNRPVGVIKIQ